ncbi:MAG: nuclear transport factor 2 family protein [Phycisphaerae bacterium]|nr:nuclear transport factor 2 family protein [Phycisphaerae bacterium]
MPNNSIEKPVKGLWEAFGRFDFEAVRQFLHNDFVAEWPQSNERIRGCDNFIALNKNYPGRWQVTIRRIVSHEDLVISEVALSHKEQIVYAVSFFTVAEGKIVHAVEYWGESSDPPAWRSRWVERM